MYAEQAQGLSPGANFYFFKGYFQPLSRHPASAKAKCIGGAERDRTADPLLAKQVLSQLSYSPNHRNTRHRCQGQGNSQTKWWARVDSNYRPHAYQACALTD